MHFADCRARIYSSYNMPASYVDNEFTVCDSELQYVWFSFAFVLLLDPN